METWHFAAFTKILLETFVSNLVSLTYLSHQILGKPQTGVYPISKFLVNPIKERCNNSRTSYDIYMKLGPVTKLDKRNKTLSKKFNNNVMLGNCDVVIFPICGQFGAIQKPNSGCIVCKTFIFINSNLLSYTNCKQY